MMTLGKYYSELMHRKEWNRIQESVDKEETLTRSIIGPEDLLAFVLAIAHLFGFFLLLYFIPFEGIENFSRYWMFLFLAIILLSSGMGKIRCYEQSVNPKYRYLMSFVQIFFVWVSGLYIGSYVIMVIS